MQECCILSEMQYSDIKPQSIADKIGKRRGIHFVEVLGFFCIRQIVAEDF